jgi:hypothetical protein
MQHRTLRTRQTEPCLQVYHIKRRLPVNRAARDRSSCTASRMNSTCGRFRSTISLMRELTRRPAWSAHGSRGPTASGPRRTLVARRSEPALIERTRTPAPCACARALNARTHARTHARTRGAGARKQTDSGRGRAALGTPSLSVPAAAPPPRPTLMQPPVADAGRIDTGDCVTDKLRPRDASRGLSRDRDASRDRSTRLT